jgi:3-dehydroquinate synthase
MGYGNWLHGEAVSAGMMIASRLSVSMGLCSATVPEQLAAVLSSAGLPIRPPEIAPDRMIDLMRIDKKAEQGIPKFILLESLGKATVRHAPEDLVKFVLK